MPSKNRWVRPKSQSHQSDLQLTERQAMVLRTLVSAYVGEAGPVASGTLQHLMPTPISSASIRNTLSELHAAGLVDKPHASAGRVPTASGMSLFLNDLLDIGDLGPHQQRLLDRALDGVDAAETPRQTSHLLSEYTRQLGFVMAPRVQHLRMRTIHLVAVGEGRILAVLEAEHGGLIQRVIESPESLGARELERVSVLLAERLAGRTLSELRRLLETEQHHLQGEADAWMRRMWAVGLRTCDEEGDREPEDLVIATRITLLDQPEFSDPERIRGLFAALETNQELLGLLKEIASADRGEGRVGLSVSLGQILGEPTLRDCALVAVPYGGRSAGDRENAASGEESLGVLGVIGPQRMDYGRVIPVVSYCGELVTRKLVV